MMLENYRLEEEVHRLLRLLHKRKLVTSTRAHALLRNNRPAYLRCLSEGWIERKNSTKPKASTVSITDRGIAELALRELVNGV